METMITPTLEQVLASVIQRLANFFGTTTTAVMDGMPEFLTTFAWYHTIKNIWYIPVDVVIAIAISFLVWLIFDDFNGFGEDEKLPKFLKTGFFIGLGIGMFFFAKNIALCIICPEIVGGMALLDELGYLFN